MEKKIEKLKKEYDKVINDFIKLFEEKQGVCFEYWIADNIGGIACFGDILFFNLDDIVYDLTSNQPKGQIIDWVYESIYNEDAKLNYYSYSKGLKFSDLKKKKTK